jgi:magnesium chelatase subunit D
MLAEEVQGAADEFELRRWERPGRRARKPGRPGRGAGSPRQGAFGRAISWRLPRDSHETDLALDATLRAAAIRSGGEQALQKPTGKDGLAIQVDTQDIRIKVRVARAESCILFAVDASASVGARKRMMEVKAAVLSMLTVSYQKRDKVGLISFRGERADLVLDITRSVDLARKRLTELPCGGKTPVSLGLDLAYRTLLGHKLRSSGTDATLVLVTDGRANYTDQAGMDPLEAALYSADRIARQGIQSIVLDTENGLVRFHYCEKINAALGGTLLNLGELESEGIILAVNAFKSGQ